jgi:hypothetical protein
MTAHAHERSISLLAQTRAPPRASPRASRGTFRSRGCSSVPAPAPAARAWGRCLSADVSRRALCYGEPHPPPATLHTLHPPPATLHPPHPGCSGGARTVASPLTRPLSYSSPSPVSRAHTLRVAHSLVLSRVVSSSPRPSLRVASCLTWHEPTWHHHDDSARALPRIQGWVGVWLPIVVVEDDGPSHPSPSPPSLLPLSRSLHLPLASLARARHSTAQHW